MKNFIQKMSQCFAITLLMLSMQCGLRAQEIMPFAGTITDENKTPLAGVTVIQKGTGCSTVSDENGNFSMMVKTQAVLVFISSGFETIEVPARNAPSVTVMHPARSEARLASKNLRISRTIFMRQLKLSSRTV